MPVSKTTTILMRGVSCFEENALPGRSKPRLSFPKSSDTVFVNSTQPMATKIQIKPSFVALCGRLCQITIPNSFACAGFCLMTNSKLKNKRSRLNSRHTQTMTIHTICLGIMLWQNKYCCNKNKLK